MAFYVVESKRSFLVIVEAKNKDDAEMLAEEHSCLDGESEGSTVLDTFNSIEEARDHYEYNTISAEINSDGFVETF